MTTPAHVKNVLLFIADQWRGDTLGVLGHDCVQTPHLDALAADGVAFANHYTQALPCGPARASILTSLYLHNHRTEHVDLMPTILEALALPTPEQCEGRPLLPLLHGKTPPNWRDAVHFAYDFRDVPTVELNQRLGS